jgi:hypothetical protein
MTFYSTNGQDQYILGNIRLIRATQEPCPVCGHPTGDCQGGEQMPIGKILLHGTTPSLEDEQQVLVEEDIYEERLIGELTTARFLIARKGSKIPFEKAKQLGILPDGSWSKENPTTD